MLEVSRINPESRSERTLASNWAGQRSLYLSWSGSSCVSPFQHDGSSQAQAEPGRTTFKQARYPGGRATYTTTKGVLQATSLRVQVLNQKVSTQHHNYDSYYRNPKYPMVRYFGPLGHVPNHRLRFECGLQGQSPTRPLRLLRSGGCSEPQGRSWS